MIRNIFIYGISLFFIFTTAQGQLSLGDGASSNQLLALQQISVTIGGEFIVNGTFPALTTERVDQFVTRIFNLNFTTILGSIRDENSLIKFQKENSKFALRNIELLHKDGSREILDLAKFRLNGDFINNPYLKEGDVIIFAILDLETNFISIFGAVNKKLEFQYVEGDDFQIALFFARGINSSYTNVKRAEISRLTNNGEKETIITVEINSDITLQSGDRIRVLYEERNNFDYKVLVLGEVNQPGYVTISKNSTTLREVMNKVGGVKENASLKFSELIRDKDSYSTLRKVAFEKSFDGIPLTTESEERLMNQNAIEFLKMFRTANLEMRDTLYFRIDNQLRELNGFTQLDFRNLENDSSFESNYLVKDGDVIIVPEKINEVYVWGGVSKMGYYPYKENNTVLDYIDDAGGFTEIAYGEDEVYLIKGKTRNWITFEDNENIKVEAGDYIYVKKERPTAEFWFYLSRIGAVAGILGSAATIFLIFK